MNIVVVMVTTYCGNLVAFLTFPTLETKIDSIAELVERSDVKWGLRSGTYLEEFMKEAPPGSKYQVFFMMKFLIGFFFIIQSSLSTCLL